MNIKENLNKVGVSRDVVEMVNIVVEGGNLALKVRRNGLNITEREINGVVTNGDFAVSKYIRRSIKKLFPGVDVLSEETFDSNKRFDDVNQFFILDEIDGTRWYKDNGDFWTVTMALVKNKELTAGVTFQPCTKKIWFAQKDKGAYVFDQLGVIRRMKVLEENRFEKVKIGIGTNMSNVENREDILPIMNDLWVRSRGVYIMASTALELAYLSEAITLSGYVHPQAMPWDKAAGMLMVIEAGGIATGWPERKNIIDPGLIAAANINIYNELIDVIKQRKQ